MRSLTIWIIALGLNTFFIACGYLIGHWQVVHNGAEVEWLIKSTATGATLGVFSLLVLAIWYRSLSLRVHSKQ